MILAIDQGTTGSRAFLVTADGEIAASAYSEFRQYFPQPGWVEHDADEIWAVTEGVCRRVLAQAGIDGRDLDAIGITNQRETAVAWDRRSGRPLHRAIVWQDRRTAQRCAELRTRGIEPLVRERTGLVLDPYFSATKFAWMLTAGGVDTDACALGTVDSYLLFRLTGEHATDYANASRTLLFDIGKLRWDQQLCAALDVPIAALPQARPNIGTFGLTTLFGGQVPVMAMVGDQQSALYGQACLKAGSAKNTFGTGSFLLRNAGQQLPPPRSGLITTIAWGDQAGKVDYALESSMFVTGAAVQWLRDGLGIIADAAESEALAASLKTNDDVYFVPALTGLGSPHWDPYARGTIVGLTRGSTRAHIARAALEAIAYQTVDAVNAQNAALGAPLTELRADGGATVNGWLMQFQADLLGIPVRIPHSAETTVLGVAYMAGVGAGIWRPEQIESLWHESMVYEPQLAADERERLLDGWQRALERSLDWVKERRQ